MNTIKRIKVLQTYANKDAVIMYCGQYFIIDRQYTLLLIAQHNGIVYDSMIVPMDAIDITDNSLTIISDTKETFKRV